MNTISTARLRVDELKIPQTALEVQGAALSHGSALVYVGIHVACSYNEPWVSTRARVDPLGCTNLRIHGHCTSDPSYGSTGAALSHGLAQAYTVVQGCADKGQHSCKCVCRDWIASQGSAL